MIILGRGISLHGFNHNWIMSTLYDPVEYYLYYVVREKIKKVHHHIQSKISEVMVSAIGIMLKGS